MIIYQKKNDIAMEELNLPLLKDLFNKRNILLDINSYIKVIDKSNLISLVREY